MAQPLPVFIAVERHSRRTADIYESVGSKAQAAFGNNGDDRVAFVFRFNGPDQPSAA